MHGSLAPGGEMEMVDPWLAEERRGEQEVRDTPPRPPEREFVIDNLLVRIHLIIEMILVDRPCVMGV